MIIVISAAGTPRVLLVTAIANTFRAVVSTRHVDARVNTGTTYTAADKGVPIYWANGGKVADDYEDFYDGDWDDEANARDEYGDLRALPDGVWTGSGHDGTELFDGTVSRAFGQGETGYGTPGSVTPGAGPLYSGSSADRAEERPLYGLSLELRVAFPLLASSVGLFGASRRNSATAQPRGPRGSPPGATSTGTNLNPSVSPTKILSKICSPQPSIPSTRKDARTPSLRPWPVPPCLATS